MVQAYDGANPPIANMGFSATMAGRSSLLPGFLIWPRLSFDRNYCPLPTLKINKKRLDSFFMIKIYFSCPVTKFIRIAH